jgi:hypothetical protein
MKASSPRFTGAKLRDLIPEHERFPVDDRQVKSVLPPPKQPLSVGRVLTSEGIDLEILKAYLIENGTLSRGLMEVLMSKSKEIFVKEPNIIKVDGDVVIIGDIHGQFMDMMGMFNKLKR